jgi:hypothetical protein
MSLCVIRCAKVTRLLGWVPLYILCALFLHENADARRWVHAVQTKTPSPGIHKVLPSMSALFIAHLLCVMRCGGARPSMPALFIAHLLCVMRCGGACLLGWVAPYILHVLFLSVGGDRRGDHTAMKARVVAASVSAGSVYSGV